MVTDIKLEIDGFLSRISDGREYFIVVIRSSSYFIRGFGYFVDFERRVFLGRVWFLFLGWLGFSIEGWVCFGC